MLAFRSYPFYVLLLLFAPGYLIASPLFEIAASSQNIFIRNVIEKTFRERAVETLLYMDRGQNINCPLKEISIDGLATLRFDEKTSINIKNTFNNEALCLVCMSEFADVLLLPTLAQILEGMREARIIILLQAESSNIQEFFRIISEQANTYKFVNLILLHTILNRAKDSIDAYRLQPFPTPSFQSIVNINKESIFPKIWLDFNGKTALILPDHIPPRSMLTINPRTGVKTLSGYSDSLVMEFAKKHNIQLRHMRFLGDSEYIEVADVRKITSRGILDLPIRNLMQPLKPLPNLEYIDTQIDRTSSFIVVPCRYRMRVDDIFIGLQKYFKLLAGTYFIFTIFETLIKFGTNWILRHRPNNPYWNLVLNLRAFAGVLGLPMHLSRYRTSMSLQQIFMLMCICGLVFTSYFNANLSTLLTKHPKSSKIKTFEQLRDSGLDVLFDKSFDLNLNYTNANTSLRQLIPNAKIVPINEYIHQILTLNSSCAYNIHSHMWRVLDIYQRTYKRTKMCKVDGLTIIKNVPLRYVLKRNSIYREAYTNFQQDSLCYGLIKHWQLEAANKMMATLNSHRSKSHSKKKPKPLNIRHFKWLWKVLRVNYIVSGLVFIAEIFVDYWQRQQEQRRNGIIREFIL